MIAPSVALAIASPALFSVGEVITMSALSGLAVLLILAMVGGRS